MEQTKRHSTVVRIAYRNEFPRALHSGCWDIKFLKFSIKCVPGSRRPRDTSVDVFVAAEIIQYSGNTEIKDTIPRKIYVGINLLWIIDLLFCLVTRITYFQVDKCKHSYHDEYDK